MFAKFQKYKLELYVKKLSLGFCVLVAKMLWHKMQNICYMQYDRLNHFSNNF
jgi:hypothetical protein